jgi:hypothetical protein
MDNRERDEPETAEDAEDLDLEPDQTEHVKGGGTGGIAPPRPAGPSG